MAVGMLVTAFIFSISIEHSGIYFLLEIITIILMFGFGVMTNIDRRKFVYYELPFLYLSHLTIIIAVLGLIKNG
jgi:glucose uptake protein GlcU